MSQKIEEVTCRDKEGKTLFTVKEEDFCDLDKIKSNATLVKFTLTDINGNKKTVQALMTDEEFNQFLKEHETPSSNL